MCDSWTPSSLQIWLETWLEIILAKDFWMILVCLELKYEFKCFGASALGFCQTEKWVSVKITMQEVEEQELSLGHTWVPFTPSAGTKSIPYTTRGTHNPCQPQPCLSKIDSKPEV